MGQEAGRTGSAGGFAEKTELILCLSEAGKFASWSGLARESLSHGPLALSS